MKTTYPHPKSIRRKLLTRLYERYQQDPLKMLEPEDFADIAVRTPLAANMHYLADRGLVEMMMGYHPPMFSAVRITADGIDLVENRFEFNLRFPPVPGEDAEALAEVPYLLERLVEEVDLSPADGEARRCMLRDVQYLRDEVARPEARWRWHVIGALLDWLAEPLENSDEALPSLRMLRKHLEQVLRE